MSDGTAFANACLSRRGTPYSAGPGRFGPGALDCSGMIHAALEQIGLNDSGAAGFTSLSYEDWCTRANRKTSLETARGTVGALVFLGHSIGPSGHIGVSLGNGTVVETPSAEGRKVGVSPFTRNRWTAAGLVPGLTYSNAPATVPGSSSSGVIGAFGDLASGLGDAIDVATDPIGAVTDLLGQLPSALLDVLTGGHSIAEIAIRALEVVGGGITAAVGLVMILAAIAKGGETGRAYSSTRRAGRSVARPVKRAGARARAGSRETERRAARGEQRGVDRAEETVTGKPRPRRPQTGESTKDYMRAIGAGR